MGHLLACSVAVGKEIEGPDRLSIFGSLELDLVLKSQRRYRFGKVLNSEFYLVWGGPTVVVDHRLWQMTFGIQWPLYIKNTSNFSHRLGLSGQINF